MSAFASSSDAGSSTVLGMPLRSQKVSGGDEGIAPSVLAEQLLIERATVSLLETRLVERGLLQRAPDPTSRRSHKLRLTQAGGQMLQELGPKATALGDETLAVFDDDDNAVLLEILTRLEHQLREMERRRENAAKGNRNA